MSASEATTPSSSDSSMQDESLTRMWDRLSELRPASESFLSMGCYDDSCQRDDCCRVCVYVRECFPLLLEAIDKQISKGNHRIAIAGNTGLGKTHFLYYLLWELSRRSKPVSTTTEGVAVAAVVFYGMFTDGQAGIFVFQRGILCRKVKSLSEIEDTLLSLESTWLLVDHGIIVREYKQVFTSRYTRTS